MVRFLSGVVNGLGGKSVNTREGRRNAQGEINLWITPRSGELKYSIQYSMFNA